MNEVLLWSLLGSAFIVLAISIISIIFVNINAKKIKKSVLDGTFIPKSEIKKAKKLRKQGEVYIPKTITELENDSLTIINTAKRLLSDSKTFIDFEKKQDINQTSTYDENNLEDIFDQITNSENNNTQGKAVD